MPRAFLITHRRYNGTEEFQTPGREYSPEGRVRLAEEYVGGAGQPSSDGASDCASESSSECPEELYNLTKLAEVSLAAAAGTLIRPRTVLSYDQSGQLGSAQWDPQVVRALRTAVVVPAGKSHHRHRDAITDQMPQMDEIETSLRERTRLFFERIETERESLASTRRCSDQLLEIRVAGDGGGHVPSVDTQICGSGGIERSSSSSSSSSSESSKSDDSGEDHECPDCGKKYSTSSNLARHRQTHRSLGDKKARRCPHCDKIYVSMPAFSMHVRTHNQGCKCHYCGKCFSRPWLLQGHIRTHTGEKPFKCTICNKAFADKSNLRAHVQTHSNTKPHVCGRCGKAFALKSYLYKHEESSCMRAHHRSASDKNEPSNPAVLRVMAEPVVATASPTSVIVQCSSSALPPVSSGIIRHTKNHCREGGDGGNGGGNVDEGSSKISKIVQPDDEEFIPRRIIVRSSVISSNPESRRASSNLANSPPPLPPPTRPFDFADPNLNLAIA